MKTNSCHTNPFLPRVRSIDACALSALLMIVVAGTVHAQTSWSSSVDGTWSDASKWSNGVPTAGVATNLTTTDASYAVTYDADPGNITMGALTVSNTTGQTTTLNINAANFKFSTGSLAHAAINIGAAGSVSGAGGTGLVSTAASTITIDGGSFSAGGSNFGNSTAGNSITLKLNSGSASITSSNNYAVLDISGGTFTVGGSVFDSYQNQSVISGGTYTNTSSNIAKVRPVATNSLTISGTGSYNVNKFGLDGLNGDNLKVNGGSMTVTGDTFIIGNNNFNLGSRTGNIAQTSGTVSMAHANGLVIGNATSATAILDSSLYDYRLSGGTLTLEKITLAAANHTGLGTNAFKMSGGTLNLGSGGLITGGGAGTKLIEISGGTIGATANWSSSLNMSLLTVGTGGLNGLGSGIATFRADDGAVTPTARNITLSGNLSGAGALTKTGAGVLTLSGANGYTGATNVSGGTLAINGSTSSTSLVTVQTGATLQGSGVIGGSVTVKEGGTLASGNSIESLATGALTLEALSTFAYELNNDTSAAEAGDLTAVTGNLTFDLGNAALLTLAELGAGSWTVGEKLTLISYTGTWNGGLFDYNGSTLADDSNFNFSGIDWTFNYNDEFKGTNYADEATGTRFVTMTAIPEPSAAALLGAFGVLALVRRRRA